MKNLIKLNFLVLVLALIFSSCSKNEDDSTWGTQHDGNGRFDPSLDSSIGNFTGSSDQSGEGYNEIEENPWVKTNDESTSTFSIDADGGSYSNARRFLEGDNLPPADAIRTEEIINYFQYDYPEPNGNDPISLDGEITDCPWVDGNKLLRIGLKGKHIDRDDLPAANFVFLIDVSGSMGAENKLPLLKESFIMFADNMKPDDRIAIVTYAGSAGVVLESTSGRDVSKIKAAIEVLGSGGSTNGAEGILTAYDIAETNFITGGNNRVIIGTDGDFNVGVSSQDGLVELIEEKRESGVFLSVLGVGTGNYQDGKMEQLANNGNGTYEYIDNIDQARKVFVEEMGKFYAVAKDVKVQIDFNPDAVLQYRLIGYENRLLDNEDFEDDTKDAGEMGADQAVTALYELVMKPNSTLSSAALTIDFRYKLPEEDVSQPLQLEVYDELSLFENASENTRFAAAAAAYGLQLRDSEYKGDATWDDILKWATNAQRFDPNGYRSEFLPLIKKAKELQ